MNQTCCVLPQEQEKVTHLWHLSAPSPLSPRAPFAVPAGWCWGAACVAQLGSGWFQLPRAGTWPAWPLPPAAAAPLTAAGCSVQLPRASWPWCEQPALLMYLLCDTAKLGGFCRLLVRLTQLSVTGPPRSGFPECPSKGAEDRAGQGWVSWWVSGHPVSWFSGCVWKYHPAKWNKKYHAIRAQMLSPKLIEVRKLILRVDLQYLGTVGCSKEVVRKAPWWAFAVNYLIFINFLTTSVNFLSFYEVIKKPNQIV